MFKFLRKYNKWILVVGGTLLMITFIAPNLIQQFGGGNPAQQLVGAYDGGNIDAGQINQANTEVRIATQLAPAVMQSLGIQGGTHWFLATRLAERNGFLGAEQDGRAFLELVARSLAQQQAGTTADTTQLSQIILASLEDLRLQLINESGYTPQQIDLALARLRSIDRLVGAVSGEPMGSGIALSGPEFAAVGRRLFEQARADILVFNANSPIVADLPPPSETQLQDIFEKHQAILRGQGEFGIGYYRQPAVALEWATILRARVSNAFVPDPVKLREFFLRNRDNFGSDFESARPMVEAEFRRREVDALMEAGSRAVRSELLRASRALPMDGRFRALPEDWHRTRPTIQDLSAAAQAAIAQAAGFTAPTVTAETGLTSDLVEPERLTTLGTISSAFQPLGNNRQLSFQNLVLSVRELNPETPFPLQRGLTYGPISDAAGNISFFTIVEVRPEGPAPILDVVRPQVEADARNLIAFQELSSESLIATIRSVLEEEGSGPAGELSGRIVNAATVGRNAIILPTGAASLGPVDSPTLRDAVMARIASWDPLLPASEIPIADRVLIVPIPTALSVAAVLITDFFPATRQRVRSADATVSFEARDRLRSTIALPVLSFEALSQTMNFRAVRSADQIREEEEFAAEEAAEAARAAANR